MESETNRSYANDEGVLSLLPGMDDLRPTGWLAMKPAPLNNSENIDGNVSISCNEILVEVG